MEFNICESDTNKTKKKRERNHTQRMIQAVDFIGGVLGS
jgi:hypothetical protein